MSYIFVVFMGEMASCTVTHIVHVIRQNAAQSASNFHGNREDLQCEGSDPGLVTQGAPTPLKTHTETNTHAGPPSFSARLELIN